MPSLKLRVQIVLFGLVIASTARCDIVPALEPQDILSEVLPVFRTPVGSVNWCGCNYLAVGAFVRTENVGQISVYQFDQATETLSLIGTPAQFGFSIFPSVSWCPTCSFLAAGGQDNNGNGIIQVYNFDHTNGIEPVAHTSFGANNGGAVYSVDWCPSCSIFAAGGFDTNGGEIQIYNFTGTSLSTIVGPKFTGAQISSLKWCGDCHYLAAVDLGGNLHVYTFDGHSLTGPASAGSSIQYFAVDWCDTCSVIAAGGKDFNSNIGTINIYGFNGTDLSPVITSTTIPAPAGGSSRVTALAWCHGCDNLAVAAFILDSNDIEIADIVNLYHFETATGTLSSPKQYTLSFSVNIFPASLVDWCGTNCCFLAVGGEDVNEANGFIQLFKGNECLIPPTPPASPTNLTAQKIYHRFPTQTDIINQLCWNSVIGAVAYNVYADAALSILLATITNPPLCYLQHQICSLLRQRVRRSFSVDGGFGGQAGKSATYYVTAVDANGIPSEPAVVTI